MNKLTISLFLFLASVLISFTPLQKDWSERIVIGKVTADMTGDGIPEDILKVRINYFNKIILCLEVYKNNQFIKRLPLPEKKDAMFSYKQKRSNILADDIDGDGKMDVLTTSRNEMAESILSVLSYKKDRFQLGI